MDLVHQLARLQNFLERDDGLDRRFRAGERHAIQNFPLLRLVRIIEDHLEHEAVHLRFGQWIRAFLVNRVFRGEHEERRRQFHRFAAERDLPLLHCFKQGALDFRRGAVDFVGQNKVRKDRAARGMIFSILRIVNQRADDVSRQQIGRELDAVKIRPHRRCERAGGKCFGEAGHAFEQDMAVRQQADEQPVHERFLADDDVGDFFAQLANPNGRGRDLIFQRSVHAAGIYVAPHGDSSAGLKIHHGQAGEGGLRRIIFRFS